MTGKFSWTLECQTEIFHQVKVTFFTLIKYYTFFVKNCQKPNAWAKLTSQNLLLGQKYLMPGPAYPYLPLLASQPPLFPHMHHGALMYSWYTHTPLYSGYLSHASWWSPVVINILWCTHDITQSTVHPKMYQISPDVLNRYYRVCLCNTRTYFCYLMIQQ